VLMQIVQRWLPSGFAWTGEIARFAMVWATFSMSGWLLAHDSHIAIKVVDLFLPVRALGAVKLLGHLIITVTCAVMMYGVFDFMEKDRGQVTAAAGVPLALIYTVVAFGFASTALRGLLAMVVMDIPEIRSGVKADA
jgi:TRAP-type C4-dicarboxylate transport system permease small subunit